MSNEENDFNGQYYLMNAKNERQYLMPFVKGRPDRENFKAFSENGREIPFVPNEVIIGFDEDSLTVEKEGTQIVFKTTVFQLTVPDHADKKKTGWKLSTADISYEASFTPSGMDPRTGAPTGITLDYNLTNESIKTLKEEGFTELPPQSFSGETVPAEKLQGLRGPQDLATVATFPPQHENGAYHARKAGMKTAPKEQKMKIRYKVTDSEIEAVIKKYCKDLTELAANGDLDPVVGREEETDQALKVLSRRKQASLCFTGDAGVGKTAMFYAVAQRIADDKNVPEILKEARVLDLDLQSMNAGAKYRGQFEEKLKPLIDGLRERKGILRGKKVVFGIDEIHSQLTAGKAEGGSDAGNIMKPFLTSIGISVMGTTTDEEYKKHIEKDGALASRFERMRLQNPEAKQTKLILQTLWPLYKEHHDIIEDLSEEDFDYIVNMTDRYAPNEAQPRKSEKVLDMAGSSASFNGRTKITKDDVISAVAQMSGLKKEFLDQRDADRFLRLEKELPEKVLGQPELGRIVDGLIGARSGLTDPNQPWGCFVMQGPTGTGKTETAKALAEYLLGDEKNLIKLDMSEYSDKHTVSRLIGAPPGFVGFDSAEPALTEKIRQNPYSVLLLDEIEKAHPDVFNVLLPILNDGKMTDNQGKTVLFNNVIVLMTSNAGASEVTKLFENKNGGGMQISSQDTDLKGKHEKAKAIYAKARRHENKGPFRPEMINRIEELGGFVVFEPLSQEVINKLVIREVSKVNERLQSQAGMNLPGVEIKVPKNVMEQLAKEGYNPAMGARPLRKVVREKIANPLGKFIMNNKENILATLKDADKVVLEVGSIDKFAPTIKAVKAKAPETNTVITPANTNTEPKVDLKKRRALKKKKVSGPKNS